MDGEKLDNLTVSKISSLTNGSKEEFLEEVKNGEYTSQDLETLIEAEKSGKNRDRVIKGLEKQLKHREVQKTIEESRGYVTHLEESIEGIEDLDVLNEEDPIDIDQDRMLDLVGGTVDELKEFVNSNYVEKEDLESILEAEKKVKERKTAINFLEDKIEEAGLIRDLREASMDIRKVEEDIERLEKDTGTEEEGSEEDESEDSEGGEEADSDGKDSIEEEEKDDDGTEDSEEDAEEDKEAEEDSEEDEQDTGDEDDKDVETDLEEEEDEDESEEDEGDGEESEPEDSGEEEDEDVLEEKKEINDELGLGMSEEELEAVDIEELRSLQDEKEERENLIDLLSSEGLEEEELRKSSTSDLRKLKESMGLEFSETEEREENSTEDEEEEKTEEEIKEEAEEDLEMLMGAVSQEDEEDEDSGPSTQEKIQQFKENLKKKISRGGDDESEGSGIDEDKVREVLEDYRELSQEEAGIKIAHVMKGYLEHKLKIEREMTYKELAENLPDMEEFEQLRGFFERMHKEEYIGNIKIDDLDELIDQCEEVLETKF